MAFSHYLIDELILKTPNAHAAGVPDDQKSMSLSSRLPKNVTHYGPHQVAVEKLASEKWGKLVGLDFGRDEVEGVVETIWVDSSGFRTNSGHHRMPDFRRKENF